MRHISFKKAVFFIGKWCVLGVLIGTLGGLVGACFAHVLSFVTGLRQAFPWLILLLPLGSLATTFLYRVFRMSDYGGVNEILSCLTHQKPIRIIAAPLIFVSGAITHLLGGSAGREGAALQLGGAGAAGLCRVLRLKEENHSWAIFSGMSAVFAGLFGTPLTAGFFVLEFKASPKTLGRTVLPCFLSSMVAAKVSSALGVAEETIHLAHIPSFTFVNLSKILVLVLGLSLLARLMCLVFHKAGPWLSRLISNNFLRGAVAATVLIALTCVVGDMRYNGSGMSMAITAAEGKADWFDFLLKLTFTAVTLAAGLKGGEIVPTFCIGATFGCVLGSLLGMDAGFAAALGLVGLFCCATNSPISGIFLGMELCGVGALPYYILICLLLWPLSVKKGLFQNRFFQPLPVSRILSKGSQT